MTDGKERICPMCKRKYKGYPALSRKDNKTFICSDCGVKEAMEDYKNAIERKTQIKGGDE